LRREVLRSWDGPPLLFVATLRTAGDPDRGTDVGVPQLGDVRYLDLPRLTADEARALALSRLAGGGIKDEEAAAQIAGEAQGHPLFIDQLGRHTLESGERNAGRARLDEAIWGRIRRLDEPLRKLVELVAVAGAPITQEAAAAAAG